MLILQLLINHNENVKLLSMVSRVDIQSQRGSPSTALSLIPSTNAVPLLNHHQESNMRKPYTATTTPFAINVEKGKDYY